MKKDRVLILIIIILLIIIVVGYIWFEKELNRDVAIAMVNGEKISEKEFITVLKDEYGKNVLENMINKKVVYEAAEKYGIAANNDEINRQYNEFMRDYETEQEFLTYLETQMGWTKEELIGFIEYNSLWEEIATKDISVTEGQITEYYNKNKSYYSIPESFHIQQIVVKTKDEANQVINELNNGSDFNTLAKERSIDYLTLSTGGDLGKIYVNDQTINPSIINKAKTMKINDIAIVQIGDYYAVIQVLAHNKAVQYSLDEVKSEIKKQIALSQANSLPLVLEQLKEDMKVEILDNSFINN